MESNDLKHRITLPIGTVGETTTQSAPAVPSVPAVPRPETSALATTGRHEVVHKAAKKADALDDPDLDFETKKRLIEARIRNAKSKLTVDISRAQHMVSHVADVAKVEASHAASKAVVAASRAALVAFGLVALGLVTTGLRAMIGRRRRQIRITFR